MPEWIEEEYRETKFNNLKNTYLRNIYKKLITIKTDKYLSEATKKTYDNIHLDKIDLELGLRDEDKDSCC